MGEAMTLTTVVAILLGCLLEVTAETKFIGKLDVVLPATRNSESESSDFIYILTDFEFGDGTWTSITAYCFKDDQDATFQIWRPRSLDTIFQLVGEYQVECVAGEVIHETLPSGQCVDVQQGDKLGVRSTGVGWNFVVGKSSGYRMKTVAKNYTTADDGEETFKPIPFPYYEFAVDASYNTDSSSCGENVTPRTTTTSTTTTTTTTTTTPTPTPTTSPEITSTVSTPTTTTKGNITDIPIVQPQSLTARAWLEKYYWIVVIAVVAAIVITMVIVGAVWATGPMRKRKRDGDNDARLKKIAENRSSLYDRVGPVYTDIDTLKRNDAETGEQRMTPYDNDGYIDAYMNTAERRTHYQDYRTSNGSLQNVQKVNGYMMQDEKDTHF